MPEPIAIVGLACRFPGAPNAAAFWQLLLDGGDAITEVPAERWAVEAVYAADPAAPGKSTSRWGGFLSGVDQFDPAFFGITPREAHALDPQHRLLLETAWEAFEDAGLPPGRFAGQPVGVFVGLTSHDYAQAAWADVAHIGPYTGPGVSATFAANRLSYAFDFRGPSLTLDTACSSALVALHLACQSLQTEESSLALVGAANVISLPAGGIGLSKLHMQSPSGRGRPFDARADGYVRSEGAGCLLLKPLSAAQADGDSIYAVIRGTAVNQDGRTNGIYAPNRWAQEAVLRSAYRRAGVAPGQVQYVEAQATGTLLGDAVELKALGAVLAEGRPAGRRCAVGSVKPNIGHSEAAAGLASLIKVALALKYRWLPPTLNFEQPNPNIPFDSLPLRIQQTLAPWPESDGPALAGVSAFGLGGTNAHVVLAAAPIASGSQPAEAARPWHVLALSAKSEPALRALAGRCAAYLAAQPGVDLNALCATANAGRSVWAHRLAAQGATVAELAERLAAYAQGGAPAGVLAARAPRRPSSSDVICLQPPASAGPLAEWQARAGQLAAGFIGSVEVDWNAWHGPVPKLHLAPTYPFQRQRYWLDPPALPAAVAAAPESPSPSSSADPGLYERLMTAPADERLALLRDYLRRQFARVLQTADLTDDHSLLEAGLDSIMLLEALWQIERDLRVQLEPAVVFELPYVAQLAGLLALRLAAAQPRAVVPTQPALHMMMAVRARPALGLETDGESSPLSFAQQRLWLLEQLAPGEPLFNVNVIALRLAGPLDLAALEQAVNALARRQASLRTTFVAVDGLPSQVVAPPHPLPLPVLDASVVPLEAREAEAKRLAVGFVREPFDLERGPLWRVALVRVAPADYLLLFPIHHIISDGWSVGVLFKELSAYYGAALNAAPASLPALEFQYADYARWQRAAFTPAALAADLDYWRERLSGDWPELALPGDRPRPAQPSLAGAVRHFALPPATLAGLRELSKREGVTLYMTLLAAFNVLLYRYTGQTDLLVGTPTAERDGATADLIGMFVNTLALRTEVAGDLTFRELLARVRSVTLGALAHHDLPFEKLVEALQPQRDPNRLPFFQTMFIWQNMPLPRLDLGGLAVSRYEMETSASAFDLTLTLWDLEPVTGEIEYKTDLFDAASIQRLIGHWLTLLAAIAGDTSAGEPIAALPLLTPAEHAQLQGWNQTQAPFADGQSLPDLFSQQARRTPEALAVVSEDQSLTYQALDERSNQLARLLGRAGVKPESRVGLCLERSPEMLVGLLGILKAGAAYVPLDPAYPAERLAVMLADAGLSALLTDSRLRLRLPAVAAPMLRLDADADALAAESGAPLPGFAGPASAVYVMYTSGSTGVPKGVVVEQRALVNYSQAAIRHYALGPGDRVLQFASLSWDTSAEEIFPALLSGAALVLRTPWMLTADSFVRACREWRVTVLILATAYWHDLARQLAEEHLALPATVRLVVFGGEPAQAERLAQWWQHVAAGVRLVNTYGATEAAAVSTWYDLPPEADARPIPIGRPLPNVQVYVLDERLQPVPVGVTGRLYLGGVGLARGYWNQPELTAEKFIPRPAWLADSGAAPVPAGRAAPDDRLYATGDLARWRPDGVLECLGRADTQVKVRGFRVELGEVEAALQQHPAVIETAVLARLSAAGDHYLVAYVAARVPLTDRALYDFLRARLPDFMLPAGFVFLDALPRLPGVKLDRAGLARLPNAPGAAVPGAGGKFVPPRDLLEAAVAEVWRAVLQREAVGVHDNFFELGGHSLLATQVVSRLRQVLRVDLTLRQMFEAPTIAEVAALARASAGQPAPDRLLTPAPRPAVLPLSYSQERLWFVHQLDPLGSAYHVVSCLRLEAALDRPALAAALTELTRRHETLRTTFLVVDGQVSQRIHPDGALAPVLVDVRAEAEPESAALRQAAVEARRPFDLAAGPLLRLTLYQLAENGFLLLIVLHHIIADNWTLTVLARELGELYQAFGHGQPSPLPALPFQYADYAVWQRAWLAGARLEAQLDYWRQQLAGAPVTLDLPIAHPRRPLPSSTGGRATLPLEVGLLDALTALAHQAGATLFMTLLAAFDVLLYRYSGQSDLLVGVPIANRTSLGVEGLMGAFVNTLVLRAQLGGQPSFRELLARVRETALEAYAHQDLPFEKLVEALQPPRDLSRNPLFQVMFNMPNAPLPPSSALPLRPVELDWRAAQFDLTLSVFDHALYRAAAFDYNTALFEPRTIQSLLAHFVRLLESIVANPDQSIADLPLLTHAEQHQRIVAWNDTRRPYPGAGDSLHRVFEAQARQSPAATAVIFGGQYLVFSELNGRANQLARHLQAQGVRPGDFVAVSLARSPQMIVALLAVLKTGAAYVALDPAYPRGRLAYMLADSQARVIITQPELLAAFPAPPEHVICLDADQAAIASHSVDDLSVSTTAEAAAYVLYTSGSTGRPKGVVAPHRGALNRCQWMWEAYPFAPAEVCAQKTSLNFVDSVAEILGPLLRGVPLVILPDEVVADPPRFIDALAAAGVTRLVLVPSLLRILLATQTDLAGRLPRLTLWMSSGEALDTALCAEFKRQLPAATLLNLYGSSEVAADVTCFDTRQALPAAGVPIGRPIANTQLYLLDANGQPVPAGVPGELYVGGHGLALGYLHQPALTAERFMAPPPALLALGLEPGARLYRTGDRARYLPDGNLLWLGRVDHQMKLRGMRVELDEIEAVLSTHPQIAASVIIAREEPAGGLQLAAYATPRAGPAPSSAELRRYLAQKLPAHMLPTTISLMSALPLLPNGKVDRGALAARADWASDGGALAEAPSAPRTPTERALAELWAEVLGRAVTSVRDNFFALGGHSLLAMSLFARIQATLGRDLPVAALFQAPTLAELAALIDADEPALPAAALTALVAIQPGGTRRPFFCVHPLGGGVAEYGAIARHLDPQQPFYGLRAKGLDDPSQQALSIEALAADYLLEIQAVQPAGPYALGGYSSGGLIAFEMARQLRAAGQTVALVALLDSYAPPTNGRRRLRPAAVLNLLATLPPWLDDFARLEPEARLARVRRKLRRRKNGDAGDLANFLDDDLSRLPPRHSAFIQAHYRAILAYRPAPYAGPVTLFRARAQALSRAADPDKGWGPLALGGVDIREFAGSHHTLLAEPFVQGLARQLERKLEEIDAVLALRAD